MGDKPIKSVQRVFEILEMFDKERRPLAAKEISKRLGYPLMSAHELFKSMHQLGYLDFEPSDRTYIPSQAFTSALNWVSNNVDRETDILALTSRMNETTGETINISRRFGTQVKIIHGLETRHPVGVSVKVGTTMPITTSLTGIAILACFEENDLDIFLRKLPGPDPIQFESLNRQRISEVSKELKERGTVMKTDIFIEGIGAICMPVHAKTNTDIITIGVVGPSERILKHQEEYRKSLKKLAREYNLKTVFKIRNLR